MKNLGHWLDDTLTDKAQMEQLRQDTISDLERIDKKNLPECETLVFSVSPTADEAPVDL